jgi:hypothetical protein
VLKGALWWWRLVSRFESKELDSLPAHFVDAAKTVDGKMLKVHGNDGKVHEGELFAVDPISKALVLKIDGSYSIFNPSQISRIEGDLSQANPPSLGDLGIR